MEWLSQNWVWIIVIVGALFLLLPRSRQGGMGRMGGMGGCCGGHAAHESQAPGAGRSTPPAGKGCH